MRPPLVTDANSIPPRGIPITRDSLLRDDGSMLTPPLDNDAVLWSRDAGDDPLIVFLHGYGSDERDLFALREHLPEDFVYASVRAPLEPPFPMSGHSWYAIDSL